LLGSCISGWAADFSGFWKENCADPYGLQIAPYRDGQYTITFCGPGDPHCNAPPDPRTATPIDGDAQYEVLAADKLRITYSESVHPVYVKCTPDIHPLLKYEHSAAEKSARVSDIAMVGLLHLLYLAIAVAGFRSAYRRASSLAPMRRRVYRTGLAALLFSPGMLIVGPAAMPSFALLSLVAFLISIPFGVLSQSLGLLVYGLGPVLVVWGLLFLLAQFIGRSGSQPGAQVKGP
jgi:hypothetical protein